MRIRCFRCGIHVTTELPEDTIFRGTATCPECEKPMEEIEMKLHKRTQLVSRARLDFGLMLAKFLRKHDLTDVEILQMFVDDMQSNLKFMLRKERHGGRTNIPAEWAND